MLSFTFVTIIIIIVLILLSFHICDRLVRIAILGVAAALLSYIIMKKMGLIKGGKGGKGGSCCGSCADGGKCEGDDHNHSHNHSHSHSQPVLLQSVMLPASMGGYMFQCVHCNSRNVSAFTNDGGSMQTCNDCGKTYKALRMGAQPPPRRFEGSLGHRGEGNSFDPDWRFHQGETVKGLYGLMGCTGDTRLANRSIWQGTQSKRAMDIRARADKHNFAKWFTDDELGLSEKKEWWTSDDDIYTPYT